MTDLTRRGPLVTRDDIGIALWLYLGCVADVFGLAAKPESVHRRWRSLGFCDSRYP